MRIVELGDHTADDLQKSGVGGIARQLAARRTHHRRPFDVSFVEKRVMRRKDLDKGIEHRAGSRVGVGAAGPGKSIDLVECVEICRIVDRRAEHAPVRADLQFVDQVVLIAILDIRYAQVRGFVVEPCAAVFDLDQPAIAARAPHAVQLGEVFGLQFVPRNRFVRGPWRPVNKHEPCKDCAHGEKAGCSSSHRETPIHGHKTPATQGGMLCP